MTEKKEETEIEVEKKAVAKAPEDKVETKKEVKKTEKKKEVVVMKSEEKTYPIRGNIFEGIVVSAKANKTITVERVLTHYISKYERYKKVKSRVKAHVPEGIEVKEGDKVKIGETRRISKTKNFILMEITSEKK
jgi:small subunit ribosomal protein S17